MKSTDRFRGIYRRNIPLFDEEKTGWTQWETLGFDRACAKISLAIPPTI